MSTEKTSKVKEDYLSFTDGIPYYPLYRLTDPEGNISWTTSLKVFLAWHPELKVEGEVERVGDEIAFIGEEGNWKCQKIS